MSTKTNELFNPHRPEFISGSQPVQAKDPILKGVNDYDPAKEQHPFSGSSALPKVFILHENEQWILPLRKAFREQQIPYEEWFINDGAVDLTSRPPEGVFYNRMSASSHTRGHRYAIEMSGPLIAWLEAHGRRVVNNRHALQLEIRKFEQYLALQQFGLRTPKTIAVNNSKDLLAAARSFRGQPFIIKPNRGGKGTGVQLFQSAEQLENSLSEIDVNQSLDGILLVQTYIKPRNGSIVRMEFIGGRFYYAVRVDASRGFELCPADVCSTEAEPKSKFEIIENYFNPDIDLCELFLKANGMEVAAIEYAEDAKGDRYIYDVNINTNYNQEAEAAASRSISGMGQIAAFLGNELRQKYGLQREAALELSQSV